MVTRSVWRWVSISLVVAAGFQIGVARAQNTGGTGNNTGNATGSDAQLQSDRRANLTGPEQLTEGTRVVEAIGAIRCRVSDMLDRARQERDIIKVTCLNDKLTQIDVTLRSANEHKELLTTAVNLNNDGQRNHEFALLTIFRQRSDGLEAEARQCIGEEAGGFGEGTIITVRVNPNIAQEDTTQYPVDPVAPDRPVTPSPVR